MKSNSSRLIVFITGAFIGNNCWDEWRNYFEGNGYNCIAPPWPNKRPSPEELRNGHPNVGIASNRLADITNHFVSIVSALPEQPILIGHSVGGLVVQVLVDRGLGVAGVAIHSFPPYGVCTFRFSFIESVWEALSLFSSVRKTYMVRFRKWKYAFTNGMDYTLQKELYYKYATPESKGVVRDAFKWAAKVNFKKPHVPLLFISGGKDRIIPASLNFCNYKGYTTVDSIKEYKTFNNHNHLVFGNPQGMKEAAFIVNWLKKIKLNLFTIEF
jgi:pimeloyl-ACP methyl ester carboxylesterase